MSYQLDQGFVAANKLFLFHPNPAATADQPQPVEAWAFPRATLIRVDHNRNQAQLKFRFPLYEVVVELADPEENLNLVWLGLRSVFTASPEIGPAFVAVKSIVVTRVNPFGE